MTIGDRTRKPDENTIIGDANPRDQVDLFAARASIEDFAPGMKGGAVVGDSFVVLRGDGSTDITGENRVPPGEGDFEAGDISMWSVASVNASLALYTANPYNGVNSLLVTGTNSSIITVRHRDGSVPAIPVTAGEGVVATAAIMALDEFQQVYFNFTFTDDSGSFPFGSFGTPAVGAWPATLNSWTTMYASAVVPPGMTRCWVDIVIATPSASGKRWAIDDYGIFGGNSYVGPVSTSPSSDGERIELMGNTAWFHTGHPTELVPGYVRADVVRGAASNNDRNRIHIQSPGTAVGASAAVLSIEGGANSGLDSSWVAVRSGLFVPFNGVVGCAAAGGGFNDFTPANNSTFQQVGTATIATLASLLGTAVGLKVGVFLQADGSGVTLAGTAAQCGPRVSLSFDGGVTYSTVGKQVKGTLGAVAGGVTFMAMSCSTHAAAVPTGDILMKLEWAVSAAATASSYAFQQISWHAVVVPMP